MDSFIQGIKNIFGPQGTLVSSMPGFTFRKEQYAFAQAIAEVLEKDSFLVAEAGTGVGKSFAYLVPAILWAKEQGEKVLISTRTRALQQQIVDHDLPDLSRVLGKDFRYAEAKGRENYLCWNKYMNILAGRKALDEGEQNFIQAILPWAESTRTGDRKELPLSGELMQFWPILSADRHQCIRDLCPYRDKCFRLKMMRRMEKADVIVSNHALLLSDLQMDNALLPHYEYLIIDEAHAFIHASFDHLSKRFNLHEVLRILRALYYKEHRSQKGFLMHLYTHYPNLKPELDLTRAYIEQLMTLTEEYFSVINSGIRVGDELSSSYVLTYADRNKDWFCRAVDVYMEWQETINLLLYKIKGLIKELDGEEDGVQLENMSNALQEISDTAFMIMEEDVEYKDRIVWMEIYNRAVVSICSASVYTGDLLEERLYSRLRSLIMVSATLAVDQSFDNFIQRSGLQAYLEEERLQTLLEDSPFDYERQACLFVVDDMPDPGSERFGNELTGVLAEILLHAGDHSLVLFTSRRQMLQSAAMVRPMLEKQGLCLLVQNEDGDFGTLMERFKGTSRAVLFGLETFWEGIDLKGDELTCLLIVKLPFRSPGEPFSSAWDRYYRLQGKSSFKHFMLPDTAVRFKQGVGRLIRSENDHGAVVVLDPRLVKKEYGKVLRNSIPMKNVVRVRKAEVSSLLEPWVRSCKHF